MQTFHVDDEQAAPAAVAALLAGEVVIVPTDTVYGLAAVPHLPEAVQRIYQAKERPNGMHLPVLAHSVAQVRQLGVAMPAAADALASQWWPGPLTMVFAFVPDGTRPHWLDERVEVAVRIPAHPFLLDVMQHTGVLVVTSANRHGQATAADAAGVARALSPHISLVVDGGPLEATPSTLVNLTGPAPVVERAGAIAPDAIARVWAGVS